MLCIDVEFPLKEYHGQTSKGYPEFPPAPARLISSFIATGCEDTEFISALTELSTQAPVIIADRVSSKDLRAQELVYQKILPEGTGKIGEKFLAYKLVSQLSDISGGKNVKAYAPAVVVRGPVSFIYQCDSVDREREILAVLQDKQKLVSHIGRAGNHCVVSARCIRTWEDMEPRDNQRIFTPVTDTKSHMVLPVPAEGYVAYSIKRHHDQKNNQPALYTHTSNVPYVYKNAPSDTTLYKGVSVDPRKRDWAKDYAAVDRAVVGDTYPIITPHGHFVGVGISGDGDIADLSLAAYDVFGDVDIAHRSLVARFAGSFTRWESVTPVLGVRNIVILQAQIIARILEANPLLRVDDVQVVVEPLYKERKNLGIPERGVLASGGWYSYRVTIEVSDAISGPLMLGESTSKGYGLMKGVDNV